MVHQCAVCRKTDISNPELIFRRFPRISQTRQRWVSLLNLENQPLKVSAEICSNHFDPSDILVSELSGKKQISPKAEPHLDLTPFKELEEPSSFSSDVGSDFTTTNSPPKSYVRYLGEQHVLDMEKSRSLSTPSTDTASETEKIMKSHNDSQSSSSLMSDIGVVQPHRAQHVTKKRKRYIGDLASSDFSTPEKRRKNLAFIKGMDNKRKRKVHNLQKTVRRLKLRIKTMDELITYLREKCLIGESSEPVIKASLTGTAQDIFERMLKGPTRQKYHPSLRSFALTLSFYSPKAYNFVRETFNKNLPHLGTISRWYRSIDGSPGFTQESLHALILKQKDCSYQLMCNLVMDEMSIRKQVEWTGTKFTGYVDYGTNIDNDSLPEAREAFVFMLVAINASWKIPVGYFLINGLSANEKSELVKKCLEFVHESGVLVTSLTFDGAASNISMCEKLGANFSEPKNLRTKFEHPVTKEPVFIFFDPCHMIKLVRNCLASQFEIMDMDQQIIKWDYVTKLAEKQSFEGLHAATKLRLRHIQWQREKMKVRLAAQTISKSVSDALAFLNNDLKDPLFQNSTATSTFLLNFNNLFDIFNARNRFTAYSYKRPLSNVNENSTFEFFDYMKSYIIGLNLKGRPILQSQRKTGYLGFLVCMESLGNMYTYYVKEKQFLKYILTYKLSQDHLELFFGSIRSKGGFNNNPTARQFEAAYKRLLVHSEIRAPKTGNAIDLDSIKILTCGSAPNVLNTQLGEKLEETDEFQDYFKTMDEQIIEQYLSSNAWNLTCFVEDVVSYIAGFVVKGLKKIVNCKKCLDNLEVEESISQLQKRKTFGKLVRPSDFVVKVCKEAEKFFRFFNTTQGIFNKKNVNLLNALITKTQNTLSPSIFEQFGDHIFDDEVLAEHPFYMSKLILKSYFSIRIHYETRKRLDQTKLNRSRSLNTKNILFRNE